MKKNLLVITLVYVAACQTKQTQSLVSETAALPEVSSFEPSIRYAEHFTIDVSDNFKTVVVKNPWEEGDTLVSYVLYPKGAKEPSVEWGEFKIPVPIEAVVATSSPHIGFIALLEELEKITGVADDRYIFNAYLFGRVNSGEVSQVGSLKGSNLEVLLDLSPDLVMKTGIDNVRNEDARLTEAGIPISYNVEWMENDLLARAEWVKFVGAFFSKDEQADSIFSSVEREYLNARSITEAIIERPSIMTGNNFKGTWYMPSSGSYVTKLIHDAGGEYKYKDIKATGSLPLSFEVVLDDLIDADYWIGPRAQSLTELEMMDERYKLFKAFKDGNVYTANKRMSENGGNDYWESGMTRPDLILKDVIKIFHPDLLPDHQFFYYKKLASD